MTAHDQLERQLRAAVATRRGRGRRPRWVVGAALALAVGAGGAAATATVLDDDRDRERIVLVFAVRQATADLPACRPAPTAPPASVVAAPPSAPVLAALPALRRPPSARERALTRRFARGELTGRTVLAGGGRLFRPAGAAGGTFVLVSRERAPVGAPADLAGCAARRATELARRAPGEDPEVVAAVRAELRREDRLRTTAPDPATEQLTTVDLRPDGRMGGAGAGPVRSLTRGTGLLSTTLRRPGGRPSLEVRAVLPARVARVRVEVTRRGRPTRRRTIPVPDHALAFVTPLDGFRGARLVLLAADGRELGRRRVRW